ncbi:MAG: radical SAM protein [Nitrospinota bacterium]|nr:radical SAM protein [Nitrospinota bacterium]
MKLSALYALTKQFLKLSPTVPQVLNTMKYSMRFFSNSFSPAVSHDPLSIGVYITYHCNLECPFCWNQTINKKEFLSQQMNIEEFSSMLQHPRLKNAFRLSFVGGEPLIHPDIFQFIEIAHSNKKLTMFPSNGLLIEKRLDEFKNSHLSSLQVSLYDGNISDQIRNVELLRSVNLDIDIALARYVTTEQNSLDYMTEVIKMSEQLNLKQVCFQNFIATSKENENLCIFDDNIEILEYFKDLDRKYGKRLNIMFPAPLKRNIKERFCYDLYTVVFVGKNGILAPCSSIVPPDRKFGNLSDDQFWNKKYFLSHRKYFTDKFPFNPTCEYCYESSSHERTFI